jgi:low temperature requirement protein LtrA
VTTEPATAEEERHATWAELFFDLVAVAGVARADLPPEVVAEAFVERFGGSGGPAA